MTFYVRNLPHWHPDGRAVFLTWRLYGSLPYKVLEQLKNYPEKSGKQFLYADHHLDRAQSGPLWLKDPPIARLVQTSIRKGESPLGHYSLYAYVLMANHVHLLIQPRISIQQITGGIKGATARYANQILERTGKPFWQAESFDHWVRTPAESEKIRTYIEQNPVKAGLVNKAEDWPWSSAHSE